MSVRQILNKIGLAICVFVIVSPAIFFFLWMLSLSVKYEIDNASYPPVFIPDRFAWQNYVERPHLEPLYHLLLQHADRHRHRDGFAALVGRGAGRLRHRAHAGAHAPRW